MTRFFLMIMSMMGTAVVVNTEQEIKLTTPKTHEITIASILGNLFTTELNDNQTVEDLKKIIFEKTDVPIEKQILFYKGTTLEDFQEIEKYALDEKTTLELYLRYF
ncbi:hypothetical protein WA026_011166 [Henosepilachna vigintioctopunctata]|uniref:Ubiquitin-like domain-containing protein n=1 Tax=Henosepilachna vigintioctopunctata TaxID=420089 RepID=A0AAW1TWU1_9CUCU